MYARFSTWLSDEPKGLNHVSFLMSAFIASVVLKFFGLWLISYISYAFTGTPDTKWTPEGENTPAEALAAIFLDVWIFGLFVVVGLALFEEILFRALPLSLGLSIFGHGIVAITIAILVSIAFAYIHFGWISIPVQGIGGIVYSIVYIKCGGWRGAILKPLVSTTILHAMFNLIIFSSLILAFYSAPPLR